MSQEMSLQAGFAQYGQVVYDWLVEQHHRINHDTGITSVASQNQAQDLFGGLQQAMATAKQLENPTAADWQKLANFDGRSVVFTWLELREKQLIQLWGQDFHFQFGMDPEQHQQQIDQRHAAARQLLRDFHGIMDQVDHQAGQKSQSIQPVQPSLPAGVDLSVLAAPELQRLEKRLPQMLGWFSDAAGILAQQYTQLHDDPRLMIRVIGRGDIQLLSHWQQQAQTASQLTNPQEQMRVVQGLRDYLQDAMPQLQGFTLLNQDEISLLANDITAVPEVRQRMLDLETITGQLSLLQRGLDAACFLKMDEVDKAMDQFAKSNLGILEKATVASGILPTRFKNPDPHNLDELADIASKNPGLMDVLIVHLTKGNFKHLVNVTPLINRVMETVSDQQQADIAQKIIK